MISRPATFICAWVLLGHYAVALAQEATPTERAIEEAITPNDDTTSREFWIATINALGEKDRIGLIFGMADNFAFCQEITWVYRERYPNNIFFCEAAN